MARGVIGTWRIIPWFIQKEGRRLSCEAEKECILVVASSAMRRTINTSSTRRALSWIIQPRTLSCIEFIIMLRFEEIVFIS
jgi:hypothetical protein